MKDNSLADKMTTVWEKFVTTMIFTAMCLKFQDFNNLISSSRNDFFDRPWYIPMRWTDTMYDRNLIKSNKGDIFTLW